MTLPELHVLARRSAITADFITLAPTSEAFPPGLYSVRLNIVAPPAWLTGEDYTHFDVIIRPRSNARGDGP
jgi:hypothetical protein